MNLFHPIDCSQPKRADSCYMADNLPVMAYVPWQNLRNTFELDKALAVGTIFPELDKPFLGKRGRCL